ncbi:hypothetical protein BST61_g7069 [Cercospora zeina]
MGLEDSMWATPGAGTATKAPAVRAPPPQPKRRAPVTPTASASAPMSVPAPIAAVTAPRGPAVNRLGVADTTYATIAPVHTASPTVIDPRTVQLWKPRTSDLAEARDALDKYGNGGFAARKAPSRGQDGPPVPRLSAAPSTSFASLRDMPVPPARETRASPAPSGSRKDDFLEQALAKMRAQGEKQPAATVPVPVPEADQTSMMGKKHGRQEEQGAPLKNRPESTATETSMKNEFSPMLPPHKRPRATAPLNSPTEAAVARLPLQPAAPNAKNWDEKMLSFKNNILDKAGLGGSPTISAKYETAGAIISTTIGPLDADNAEHKAAAIEAEKVLSAQMEKAAKRKEEVDKTAVFKMKEDKVVALPKEADVSEPGSDLATKLLVEKERINKERKKLNQAEEDVDARIAALTQAYLGA